jgi:hypothetical protein
MEKMPFISEVGFGRSRLSPFDARLSMSRATLCHAALQMPFVDHSPNVKPQ